MADEAKDGADTKMRRLNVAQKLRDFLGAFPAAKLRRHALALSQYCIQDQHGSLEQLT